MKLDFKKFKKVATDGKSTKLRHNDGHEITIAHSPLSPKSLGELKALPMYAMGGGIEADSQQPMGASGGSGQKTAIELAQESMRKAFGSGPKSPPVTNKAKGGVLKQANPKLQESRKMPHYAEGTGDVGAIMDETSDAAPSASPGEPTAQDTAAVDAANPMSAEPVSDVEAQNPQAEATPASSAASMPDSQPEQPSGSSMPDVSMESLAQHENAGINAQEKAETMRAAATAQAAKSYIANAQAMQQNYAKGVAAKNDEINKVIQDYQAGHINPNHYMDSMSSSGKVATAIGLILGGMGQGVVGGTNPAEQFLNAQIDRDIEAQKANMGKQHNLLGAYFQQSGNMAAAEQMARATQMGIYNAQLAAAANSSGSMQAKANAEKARAAFQTQMMPMVMRAQALEMANPRGATTPNPIDPSILVSRLVPAEHQKAVFGEIQRAQDTRRMGDTILKSFDDAAKDNTVMRTGAGVLRTPASVMALHQSMQPTFQDLEGTVRQAAMDNTFHNITPRPGDSDKTVATKRAALTDYLQSKASAPTAKGFGIDVSKFATTQPPPKAPQIKIVNGIKYMRGPNGEAIRVQ